MKVQSVPMMEENEERIFKLFIFSNDWSQVASISLPCSIADRLFEGLASCLAHALNKWWVKPLIILSLPPLDIILFGAREVMAL